MGEKILVTGNMGYVGSVLIPFLRSQYPDSTLYGLDIGLYAGCLTQAEIVPEIYLNTQIYKDIRDVTYKDFEAIDTVVHLAGISNDPIGNENTAVTSEINYKATIRAAIAAKKAGVKNFVFASSCSVYGFSADVLTEDSPINPLTAYAKSKADAEQGLRDIADSDFRITCLRFATACGPSARLRKDLVLNDFVASAVTTGKIKLMSDGSASRPLIDVRDMCQALAWAMGRDGDPFLIVNVGLNEWNFKIKDLALRVSNVIPMAEISVWEKAQADQRSYHVDFSLYRNLRGSFTRCLDFTIYDLESLITQPEQKESRFVRLKQIHRLREKNLLNRNLGWERIKVEIKS